MMFGVDLAVIGIESKDTIRSGKRYICLPMNQSFLVLTVFDQVSNRDQRQIVFLCEADQAGHAHHTAVFVHDLAENSCRKKSSQTREVH